MLSVKSHNLKVKNSIFTSGLFNKEFRLTNSQNYQIILTFHFIQSLNMYAEHTNYMSICLYLTESN